MAEKKLVCRDVATVGRLAELQRRGRESEGDVVYSFDLSVIVSVLPWFLFGVGSLQFPISVSKFSPLAVTAAGCHSQERSLRMVRCRSEAFRMS